MPCCCAIGCSNARSKKDCGGKSFFRFPLKNPGLLKEWLREIKREHFVPNENTIICSDHFYDSCFEYQPFTNRRQLKPGSIPKKFVFKKEEKPRRVIKKFLPVPSTSAQSDPIDLPSTSPVIKTFVDVGVQTESFGEIIDKLAEQEREIKSLKEKIEKAKFIPDNITDDVSMKAITSFTRERFFSLYRFLNVEKDLEGKVSLRAIDLFFIFLVKLRTGISNEFLSILLAVSDSTVSRYFNTVVQVLYKKMKLLNIFPDRVMIQNYMPRTFLNDKCRIIIDCTEFFIQKPNSPMEQQMTFSHYKNSNTLKGLIGITPSGAVSFVSDLYCGSISDKELFLKSKLLDLLEPGDVVMADKGFLIEKELEKKGCKLRQPLFLKDKVQFESREMVSNCKLSNKRVTVERAISRIKQYKYFEGSLPYTALHSANSVFFITCILCNFHDQLIKKG